MNIILEETVTIEMPFDQVVFILGELRMRPDMLLPEEFHIIEQSMWFNH